MDETDILKERKERILAYMESEGYVPIKRRDMRAMLSVPQEDREKFESLINELIAEGRVFETKKGKLASPKDLQMADVYKRQDLKDAALQNSYGVIGAERLLARLLLAGEYDCLRREVERINGGEDDGCTDYI